MNIKKSFTFIILTFTITQTIYAQFNVSVTGGVINYGGDLQEKKFTFNQAHIAYGLSVGYKFLDHFMVAYSLTTGKVGASDSKTNDITRSVRNLSFYSNIGEASLTLEASLKDVPRTAKFSPYIFGSIALFHFNPYTFDASSNKVFLQPLGTEGQGLAAYPDRKPYKLNQFSIPFGFGIKYAISEDFVISTEIGLRKIFTDYIDDVSSERYVDTAILSSFSGAVAADLSFRGDELNPPISIKTIRGNPEKKDSYYTCLVKLTFSLEKTTLFKF